jgi:hypothetical protein
MKKSLSTGEIIINILEIVKNVSKLILAKIDANLAMLNIFKPILVNEVVATLT